MKNLTKYLAIGIAALFAASAAPAQSVHYIGTDDTAPALRIYNGATGTATFAIQGTGGTQYVATVDGLATTIAAKTNIALLAAAFAAVTNEGGYAKLTVDSSYALAGDSTVAMILSGTYTAAPNTWVTIPWDTSQCKHYDVAIPSRGLKVDYAGDKIGADRPVASKFNVTRIYGDPTGTGSATVKAYVNGVEKFSRVIPEQYVLGVGGTNTLDSVIVVDIETALVVGSQDSFLARIIRGTTAAGGNIGFIATP